LGCIILETTWFDKNWYEQKIRGEKG